MQLRTFVVIAALFYATILAQSTPSYMSNDWGWISGSAGSQIALYGLRNKTSDYTAPGARRYGVSWTDSDGNYWMYGGRGFPDMYTEGKLGDVWFYDRASKLWTWKSGSDAIDSKPSTPSVNEPSVDHWPSNRDHHMILRHDKANRIVYIFGGREPGQWNLPLADLWKFNYATLEWTYLGGEATANLPTATWIGSRYGSCTWTDSTGTTWLFGGFGVREDGWHVYLNDLWQYSPTTNKWTRIFDQNNAPAGRHSAACAVDPSDDSLYLFGGALENDVIGNDFYKFYPESYTWVRISGSPTTWSEYSFGDFRQFSEASHPSSRRGAAMHYHDGQLWLLGGFGVRAEYRMHLYDLWVYDLISGQWAWMNGESTTGDANPSVYPTTKGQFADDVYPGDREGVLSAMDGNNLFLFGGSGVYSVESSTAIGQLTDLWQARLYRDECQLGIDDCNTLATCLDLDEGYECQCPSEYEGNGHGPDGCTVPSPPSTPATVPSDSNNPIASPTASPSTNSPTDPAGPVPNSPSTSPAASPQSTSPVNTKEPTNEIVSSANTLARGFILTLVIVVLM